MTKKEMKSIFVMNGKEYPSMLSIARALGIARVYRRDFARFSITEVFPEDTNAEQISFSKTEEVAVDTVVPDTKEEETADPAFSDNTKKFLNITQITEFKGWVKKVSTDDLISIAKEIKVDTADKFKDERIHRMHVVMNLKTFLFKIEDIKKSHATYSPFRKVALEKLLEYANANNIDYKVSSDEHILRMHVTSALKRAGIKPDEIVGEKDDNRD